MLNVCIGGIGQVLIEYREFIDHLQAYKITN
jgi:hypothetical protein